MGRDLVIDRPSCYEVSICGKIVLKFDYTSIQLNHLPWRRFLDKPNPVATALMTRMDIEKHERAKVKVECLRLLATLKLDPAKSTLIGVFIETYLKLSAQEMEIYEREFAALLPKEKEAAMEMMTSWQEKGWKEGKEEILSIQLQQRFSTLPEHITTRLDALTSDQLNELGKAIFTFNSLDDFEIWLSDK